MPLEINFDKFLKQHTSPVISREKLAEASGGTTSAKTIANLDSKGEGPPERIMVGGKVAYPTLSALEWLMERIRPVDTAPRGWHKKERRPSSRLNHKEP